MSLARALLMPQGYADGGPIADLFRPAFAPAGGEAGGMSGAGDTEGSGGYGAPGPANDSTWGAAHAAAAAHGPTSPEAMAAVAAAQSSAAAMADATTSTIGEFGKAISGLGPGFGLMGVMSNLGALNYGVAPAANWGARTNAISSALADLFGFSVKDDMNAYGNVAGPGTNDSNPNGFNAARSVAEALDALGLADRETQNALDAAGRAKDPVGFGPHDVGPGPDAGRGPGPGAGFGDGTGMAEGGTVWPSGGVNWQSPRFDRNPQADVVPLMASPGEFMFDRGAVRGAGGGDLEAGQRVLLGLQQLFRSLSPHQMSGMSPPRGVI